MARDKGLRVCLVTKRTVCMARENELCAWLVTKEVQYCMAREKGLRCCMAREKGLRCCMAHEKGLRCCMAREKELRCRVARD